MAVVIVPGSARHKEVELWNRSRELTGIQANDGTDDPRYGKNAPRYERYPAMLYRAQDYKGRAVICHPDPSDPFADSFNRLCQMIVKDPDEERRAVAMGWALSPPAALEAYERRMHAVGDEAAHLNYHAQRMSAAAQAEVRDAEAQTHRHVVDVQPATRKRKRRGRHAPAVTAVTSEGAVEGEGDGKKDE